MLHASTLAFLLVHGLGVPVSVPSEGDLGVRLLGHPLEGQMLTLQVSGPPRAPFRPGRPEGTAARAAAAPAVRAGTRSRSAWDRPAP
jgi:hypothetical protein